MYCRNCCKIIDDSATYCINCGTRFDNNNNETDRGLEINKYNFSRGTLFMGEHFFDYDDGDFARPISDNMAINSDGDFLMRMGDHMAMDMDSGELHIISGWSNDEDDD